MASRDKKLAVWHRINEQTEPIRLSDLLALLGSDYAQRSVRRWLAEMVEEGLVEKLGSGRGTRYRAAVRSAGATSCFGSESLQAIEKVRLPLYERRPVAYDEGWLDAYRPNVTFYMPRSTRSRLHRAGKRSKDTEPAL